MELVYLWVDSYKNIEKQGFNFSPRFHCEYDEETNELSIDKNEDYIPDFFGENINVTAIVGKNGSGKSSVLDILFKIFNDSFIFSNVNFILVCCVNNKLFYQSEIENISTTIEKGLTLSSINYFKYISQQEAQPDYNIEEHIINLTEIHMARLICNSYLIPKKFELSTFMYIPSKIEIKEKLDSVITEKINGLEFNLTAGRIEWYDEVDKKESDRRLQEHNEQAYLIVNELRKILFESNLDEYHKFLIILYLDKHNYEYDTVKLMDKKFMLLEYSEIHALSEEEFKKYFISKTLNIEYLTTYEKSIYFKYYSNYFDIDFIDSENRKYSSLSHGEQNIFGQLLNIYLYAVKSEDKVLFLLDEPELTLHPQWQKQYINQLKKILKGIDIKFHIILTSHSPFLLSDIPKQNIIFLDKDENGNCKVVDGLKEKKQTFGANIHTLLSDSFFMEDGLMGEFAKQKINEIIDFFNNKNEIYKEDREKLKKVIETIGEPFLKDKLLRMYDEKYPKTNDEKIKALEAEIEKIKNDKNKI